MDDHVAARRESRRLQLADLRRGEILDAAVTLFAKRGYHDTTIADIAREIGMGHGVFYRYFTGKRDILDAVLERLIGEVLTVLGQHNSPTAALTLADYQEQIERIVLALYGIWDDNPALRLVLLQADAIDSDFQLRFRSTYGLVVTLIAGYLENGITNGFLRTDLDTVASAEAIVGLLLGGAMREAYPTGPGDRERYIAAAIRIMFIGITGEAGRAEGEDVGALRSSTPRSD